VPEPQRRPRRYLLFGAGLVVLVVLVVLIVVVFGQRDDSQLPKLRLASEKLTAPSGWTYMGRSEEPGSGRMCFVSCPHAAVTLLFRVGDAPGSACATIRAEVERQVGPTRADPSAACGWSAPIPGAGASSFISASTISAAELRSAPTLFPGLAPLSPTDSATYLTVRLSGGPA
jgi:hypothetical protein